MVVTETACPAKPEIFSSGSFIEKKFAAPGLEDKVEEIFHKAEQKDKYMSHFGSSSKKMRRCPGSAGGRGRCLQNRGEQGWAGRAFRGSG